MDANSNERVNEGKIIGSEFEEVDPSFLKVSKSICKIKTNKQYGTGFFIKYLIDKIYNYFLISSAHILTKDMVKAKEKIIIYFDNEFENLDIELNENIRYIRNFKDDEIDASIVQIIYNDNINDSYFLSPEGEYSDDKNKLINKQIYIPQYPLGKKLKYARGIINYIKNYELIHSTTTEPGSSGSPLFLKDSIKVIGIHKQSNITRPENYADLISPIYNILQKDYNLKKFNFTSSNIFNAMANPNLFNMGMGMNPMFPNNQMDQKKSENNSLMKTKNEYCINLIFELIYQMRTRTITISCNSSDKMDEVFNKLYSKIGYMEGEAIFLFNSRRIMPGKPGKKVNEYGIRDHSKILVVYTNTLLGAKDEIIIC